VDKSCYPFLDTLNEVLIEAKIQIDMARHADKATHVGLRLKIAQQAIQCAIEIYGDMVVEMQKEKKA
jgi:hypothetical protein